jgi:hypothetical protein
MPAQALSEESMTGSRKGKTQIGGHFDPRDVFTLQEVLARESRERGSRKTDLPYSTHRHSLGWNRFPARRVGDKRSAELPPSGRVLTTPSRVADFARNTQSWEFLWMALAPSQNPDPWRLVHGVVQLHASFAHTLRKAHA